MTESPEISVIPFEVLADLSDRLTYAIREDDWTAVSDVRNRLDALAGREIWNSTMPPRPPSDWRPDDA